MPVSISGAGSISGLDQGFNVTTGSVGVGTTNPRTDLQVGAFGGGDSNIQLATGTSGASNILFGDSSAGSNYYKGFIKYNHSTDNLELYTTDDLIHYTGGSERLRINSAGNVGIASDTPAARFDVYKNFSGIGAGTYTGRIYGTDTGVNETGVRFVTKGTGDLHNVSDAYLMHGISNGNTRFVFGANGKVGIGTDNPNSVAGLDVLNGEICARGIRSNAHKPISGVWLGKATGGNALIEVVGDTGTTAEIDFTTPNTDTKGRVGYDLTNNYLYFNTNGANERLRIDSSGHLLHGVTADEDTSGNGGLRFINSGDIQIDGDQRALVFRSTNNTAQLQSAIEWWNENGAGVQSKIACDRTAVSQAPGDLVFYTSPNVDSGGSGSDGDITERLRITSAGKVGINYNNPSYMLEVHNPNPGNDSKQLIQRWVNTNQNTLELHMYGGSVDQCQFATTNSEQTLSFLTGAASSNVVSTETSLLLTQNRDAWFQGPDATSYGGGLFIGAQASPYGNLCALRDGNKRPLIYMGGNYPEITLAHSIPSNTSHGPTIRFATYIQDTNAATGNQFVIGTNGSGTFLDIGHATAAQNQNAHSGISNYNGTYRFRVTTSGCQVNGSLSKSSGSFRIDHPLAGLSTTRDLVHSFIEGPQADLIYRGVVDLVDGTATVNIDTAGRMTEGTFEVLCTNVSCFTSNETDWTAVKGSVSGNILTITAQDNTSTATVSWMVVGERKDPHMIDTDWTDENGRVITEPLKSS